MLTFAMISTPQSTWEWFGALIAVFFGWALHELSDIVRMRREDKRAIGKALAELLEVRLQVTAVPFALRALREHLPLPPEAEPQVREGLHLIVATAMGDIHERYNNAIDSIAGRLPLLAFQLRSKDAVNPTLRQLRALVGNDARAATFLSTLEERLIKGLQPAYDELILTLARRHGLGTRFRVRTAMRPSSEIQGGLDDLVGSLVKLAGEADHKSPVSNVQQKD